MSAVATSSAPLRRPCAVKPSSPWSPSRGASPAPSHPRRLASTAAATDPAPSTPSSSSRSRAMPASSTSSQGFFIPSPSSPAANFSRSSARQAWKRGRSPYHPLVNELLTEVYSPHASPERVWSAYLRLHTIAASGSSSSIERPMAQLTAGHHQLVLRAIAPDVKQVREARRMQRRMLASSVSTEASHSSTSPSKFVFPSGYMSQRVQPRYRPTDPERHNIAIDEYVSRVRFIFQQMRGASDAHLAPDLSDYNHVLQKLAAGGHLAAVTPIWAHLTGRSKDAMAGEGSDNAEASSTFQTPAPSIETYQSLMLAVSKQLSASLERHQRAMDLDAKVRAEKSGVARQGGVRAEALQNHINAAAAGQMQARRAAILAAQRALGLIEHMQRRGIKADAMTLDLAMRTLRLAGQLESIKALLHAEYALNLDSSDTPLPSVEEAEKRRSVSIHTLNTLLMALGEQATVGEMVAAYETLSKPLPVKRSDLDEDDALGFDDRVQQHTQQPSPQEQNQSLFATNFRGLFDNDPLPSEEGEAATASTTSVNASLMTEADPLRPEPISPNTRTFRTLLRHSLSPAHAATQLSNGLGPFSRSVATAEEDERRARGAYLPVAKYVVREAVETYESQVQRMAACLGVVVQVEPASAEEVEQALQEAALEAGDGGESRIVLPARNVSTSLSSSISADFKPHFDPPATGLGPADLRPLTSFASRARNVADLAWCASWLDRLLAAREMEIAAVKAAHKLWYPLVNGTEANWADVLSRLPSGSQMPELSPDLVQPFLDALGNQERMSKARLREMETFRLSVEQRLRTLRAQRKERIRRRESNRLGAKEEELREARKREEERRVRSLLREEEIRRAAEEESSPREDLRSVDEAEQQSKGEDNRHKDAALRFAAVAA